MIILLMALLTRLTFAQSADATDPNLPCSQAGIRIDTLHFDFGRVPQWEQVQQTFFLTNTSNVPVTVKGITTSCACTAAQLPEKTIAPGGALDISLTFSSKSRFGQSLTNATITFTDPNICPIRMLLEATVFSDGPRFSPGRVHFNQVPFQTKVHESIRIVNLGDPQRQWEILSLQPSSRWLQADYLEDLGQIKITLDENYPPGNIEESVTVSIGQTDQQPYDLTLRVTGKVLGPLSAQPNQIFISSIEPGQKLTRKLTLIFADGFTDIKITSFDLPAEIIAIKQTSHTKSKSVYQLTLKSPLTTGLHKSELIFHTNHPAHPTLTVPILLFTQK